MSKGAKHGAWKATPLNASHARRLGRCCGRLSARNLGLDAAACTHLRLQSAARTETHRYRESRNQNGGEESQRDNAYMRRAVRRVDRGIHRSLRRRICMLSSLRQAACEISFLILSRTTDLQIRMGTRSVLLPPAPMRRAYVDQFVSPALLPASRDPAAGEYERVGSFHVENGKFQIKVEGRGLYVLPVHRNRLRHVRSIVFDQNQTTPSFSLRTLAGGAQGERTHRLVHTGAVGDCHESKAR